MRPPPAKDIHTREYRRISQIDAKNWDRLAGQAPLASRGWLQTVEATFAGKVEPHYLTVENSTGRALGAAVCYIAGKGPIVGDFDHAALGRLKPVAHKMGISFMPLLVCCPLYAYGRHLLVEEGLDAPCARGVTRILLDKIESLARSSGLALVFPNVTQDEHRLRQQLAGRRFCRVNDLPQSVLDIQWPNFDGYLDFLTRRGRKNRKNTRAEINRSRRWGVEIRPLDNPGPWADRILELLDMTSRRHNGAPFMFHRDFFSTLKANMGRAAVIYGAFRGPVLNGVSISMQSLTEGVVAFVGVDHPNAGNDGAYFNLTYNTPIAAATAAGLGRLYFDRHLYDLKYKKGCRFIRTSFFYKPSGLLPGLLSAVWFRLLGRWNHRISPVGDAPLSG